MNEMVNDQVSEGEQYTYDDGLQMDPADLILERFDTEDFPKAASTFGLDPL